MSLNALRILSLSLMLGGSAFGADSRLADAVQRDDKVAVRSLVEDRLNASERLGIDQPGGRRVEFEVDARKCGRMHRADVHTISQNLLPP